MKNRLLAAVAAAALLALGGAIGASLAAPAPGPSAPVTQAQLAKVRAAIINLNQRVNKLEHAAAPNSPPAQQPDTDFTLSL